MKKTTQKLLALLFVSLFSYVFVFSQNSDNRWAIGLHTNVTNYQGDLGNEFFDFGDIGDLGVGASIEYYLSPFFNIAARGAYHNVGYEDETGTYAKGAEGYADLLGTPDGNWRFSGDLFTGMANLIVKLNNGWLINEDSWFKPYLVGGVGVTWMSSDFVRNSKSSKDYSNLDLYYGAGIKLGISERFDIVLEAGIHNPMTDVYDGIDKTTAPGWPGSDASDDEFLQYSVGLTYSLGKKKDADADGVRDKKDQCPNTPEGVEVDKNGCPLDKDQDGVPDYKDECPDVKGTIKGCPDRDKDGIADKNDACPDKAGPKSLKGCPDSDKDGVIDKIDKCPNTPRKAKVDANGCPVDSDGDGLFDYEDKCPRRKGPKSNNGCPIPPKKPEVKTEKYVVHFTTARYYLSKTAKNILSQVVDKMKSSGKNITIAGHADIRGEETYNQHLSERRAKAVKKYLMSKGISESAISTSAYGESQPISQDHAQNRRAEIVIYLK